MKTKQKTLKALPPNMKSYIWVAYIIFDKNNCLHFPNKTQKTFYFLHGLDKIINIFMNLSSEDNKPCIDHLLDSRCYSISTINIWRK